MTSRPLMLVAFAVLAACSRPKGGEVRAPVVVDTGDSGAVDSGETGETGETADTGDTVETGETGETALPPVDKDGDGSDNTVDCDDSDPTVYPGAPELCDGKDNDCNGSSDADEDLDADGTPDCSDYCPVYALPDATGDGRAIDPLGTLQEAIDLAGETGCNEVRAYKGTFYENVDWHGYPVNAESTGGADTTIIDGGGSAPVVTFQTGEAEDARIYDFTLTHGGGGKGGGIYINATSPTIEGNIITANAVEVVSTSDLGTGGGIWSYNGSPLILDNTISGNDACYGGPENGCDGGGVGLRGGTPLLEGNTIADNTAGDGGGVWLVVSNGTVRNNLITGNAADDEDTEQGGQGGGINVQIGGTTGPFIENNVISDNSAGMFGGGIVTYEDSTSYTDATIVNNTIVYNEVVNTDYGAGVCQWRRTTPTFLNNIIAYNHGVGAYSQDGIDSTFTYNVVYGNSANYGGLLVGNGGGNITTDPRFVAATDDGVSGDDFHLGSGSSAVDAGNPGDAYDDVDGTRNDVGAYGGPSGAW